MSDRSTAGAYSEDVIGLRQPEVAGVGVDCKYEVGIAEALQTEVVQREWESVHPVLPSNRQNREPLIIDGLDSWANMLLCR